MGSSRLPGKTLETLGDAVVLDWVCDRVASASTVDELIVATSDLPEDDAIEDHLGSADITTVRGSALDVLDRFGVALTTTTADTIIRITADCPLIQPDLIDRGVEIYRNTGVAYVATAPDGRLPRGFDLEVIDRAALETAVLESVDPVEREHVTTFIVRRPDRFAAAPLTAPIWARHPEVRLTVDEPADLEMVRRLVDESGAGCLDLIGPSLFDFLERRPDIVAINRDVAHRHVV